jgi:hypothetical protein
VVNIFEYYSVGSFFLGFISVVDDVGVSLVLDQSSVRGWVVTVYFNRIVCPAFGDVLLVWDYVSKAAYHF